MTQRPVIGARNRSASARVLRGVSRHTAAALALATLSLGIALIGLLLMLSPEAHAQGPDDPSLRWQFTPLGILADERVQLALSLPVDSQRVVSEAGFPDLPLRSGLADAALIGPDPEFARNLLDAAGLPPQRPRLIESRRCKIWPGPSIVTGSPSYDDRLAVAAALADEIARSLPTVIGGPVQPCEVSPAGSQADIVLLFTDEPLAFVPSGAESFLRVPGQPASPAAPQALPQGGSGGLADTGGMGDAAPEARTQERRLDAGHGDAPLVATSAAVTALLGLAGWAAVRRWCSPAA